MDIQLENGAVTVVEDYAGIVHVCVSKHMYWIQQRNDSYCGLISLLNAKRYYGLFTPTYGDDEFEQLVDFARCRYGAMLGADTVVRRLGLNRFCIDVDEAENYFPFEFGSFPPERRSHSALAISGDKSSWTVVNYWCGRGPVIDNLKTNEIDLISGDIFHIMLI